MRTTSIYSIICYFTLFFIKIQAFTPSSCSGSSRRSLAYQQQNRCLQEEQEDPLFLTATSVAATTTTSIYTTEIKFRDDSPALLPLVQPCITSKSSRRYRGANHQLKTVSPLFMQKDKDELDNYSAHDDDKKDAELPSIRKELGKITGISLTALRASLRATTGFSLTALRTTLRTLTGVSITGAVKTLVGLLPPWFRYFLQPFLILYYVPLLVLKGMVGSTSTSKREASEEHDKLVDYWKDAIKLAETRSGAKWPLHVRADGTLKYDLDDDKMNDVIVEAIEMKHMDEK